MLVLSRNTTEGVRISDNIEVVVLEVRGDTVKLGFRAPADIRILRSEVVESTRIENMVSSATGSDLAATLLPQAVPADGVGS